jgi:hypothetical protein
MNTNHRTSPAPTRCPSCGRPVRHDNEIGRAARRRSYCDTTCRRRHQRARDFAKRFGDSAFFRRLGVDDTAGGEKAPRKPLKLRSEKHAKPEPSLFTKSPLNVLGTAFRWPDAMLDRVTLGKIVAREIGGSIMLDPCRSPQRSIPGGLTQ